MKKRERMRKYLSILLCLLMLVQYLTTTVLAAGEDTLCEHHAEHTAERGYAEAVAGSDCTHSHDDTCGYMEGVAGADCTHVHDDACGYAAPVEPKPCTYHCHICHVQELVDALPGEVTAENLEAVMAQLTAIDAAKLELSDAEMEQVDFAKYSAAISIINVLQGQSGAEVPIPAMQIFVQTLTGKNITLDVLPETTIAEVKEMIKDRDGSTLEHLYLFYNDQHLKEDDRTVGDYNIQPNTSLYSKRPYTVSIVETENGSIAGPDIRVPEGGTVTLTVTPDAGYVLDTLTVNDGAVEVTKVDDTTYTFTMPSAHVTVKATFKVCPHETYAEGICTVCDYECTHADHTKDGCTCNLSSPAIHTSITYKVNNTTTHTATCACGWTETQNHTVVDEICTGCNLQGTCGDNLNWTYDESTTTLTISGSGEMKNYSYWGEAAPWRDHRSSITTIVVSPGVTSIGEYAFAACTALTSVIMNGAAPTLTQNAFLDCYALQAIYVKGEHLDSYLEEDSSWQHYKDKIVAPDHLSFATVAPIPKQLHTGSAVTPDVTVTDYHGKLSTAGTDYTVAYADNTNVGTATVTITGIGDYKGTKSVTFEIVAHLHEWTFAANDNTDTITAVCANTNGKCPNTRQTATLEAEDSGYTGEIVSSIYWNGIEGENVALHFTGTNGTDYDSADYPINAGSYTVTMTVGGESVSDSFAITPKSIATCNPKLSQTSFDYTGEPPSLSVSAVNGAVGDTPLVEGTDFTVGTASVNAGDHKLTVTGKGNYSSTVELDYTINPKPITPVGATIKDVAYNPNGYTFEVTEVFFEGVVEGDTPTYTAAAQLGGTNGVGQKTVDVTVTLQDSNYTLSNPNVVTTVYITEAIISVTITEPTYNGSVQIPSLVVTTMNGKNLTASDYDVTYEHNGQSVTAPFEAGQYLLTITGKGMYHGSVSCSFTVHPSVPNFYHAGYSGPYPGSADAFSNVGIEITLVPGERYDPVVHGKIVYSYEDDAGNLQEGFPVDVGIYTVTATLPATGNYSEVSTSFNATINPLPLGLLYKPTVTLSFDSAVYTGEAIHPDVRVSYKGNELLEGTDYELEYQDNVNVGTATVVITFMGNYDGSVEETFSITQAVAAATAPTAVPGLTYNQSAQTLIAAGSTNDGRLVYSLEVDGAYTAELPKATNAGTYSVWYKVIGDGNYTDSEPASVEVEIAKADPGIGDVNADMIVDTLEASAIALTRANTDISGNLTVDAGQSLAWGSNEIRYTFTPDDVNYKVVTGIVNVTVEDTVAPAAAITLQDNWNQFWNGLKFNMFFNKTQSFTIHAQDAVSGVHETGYYLADTELTLGEVMAIAEWTEYTGPVKVDPDKVFAIYARVSDNAGNVTYVNSEGIVLDATKPVISGIEDGGIYYGDVTIAADDTYLDDVSVDGNSVELTDGTYCIKADNEEHTVVATDKAGNKTACKLAVYKIYTVTFVADGEILEVVQVNHGFDVELPDIPAKEGYTAAWNADGRNITADTIITAVYTEIPGLKPVTVSFKGQVKLNGRDLIPEEFMFALTDADADFNYAATQSLDLKWNDTNGEFVLTPIWPYTEEGIYRYRIEEVKNGEGDPTIDYDATVYQVEVIVTEEDGVLSAQVNYYIGGIPYMDPMLKFVNVYKEAGGSGEPGESMDPEEEPTEPSKPTEPEEEPTEPSKPTEPEEETTEPGKPTEPEEEPTEPSKPTEPEEEPTEPGKPMEPEEEPTEPGKPTEPEEESTEPGKPTGDGDGTSNKPGDPNNPQTGDDSNIMLYSTVFTMSIAALVVLFVADKKRKQSN